MSAGIEFEMREICVSSSAGKMWPECGTLWIIDTWNSMIYQNSMNYGFFLFQNVSVRKWFLNLHYSICQMHMVFIVWSEIKMYTF